MFCLDLVWFCFVPAKTVCRYGCMYFLAALVLVCVDVMMMSYFFLRGCFIEMSPKNIHYIG